MKKFDYFLILIAVTLIYLGYNFSQRFTKSAAESSSKESKTIVKEISVVKNRIPSQNSNNQENVKEGFEVSNSVDEDYIKKFNDFKKCIKSEDCDYSHDDPRSYELEVYQAMNSHLKNIDLLSSKNKEKILMEAAMVSDGYVKETVLKKLLEGEIYSEEWRDLILDEYISQYNSRLIPDVISYLKTYSSEADKIIVNQTIAEVFVSGSPMVANALAENLKNILDKDSVKFYKNYLSNLQEGPIKKNLAREILDYELMSSAG